MEGTGQGSHSRRAFALPHRAGGGCLNGAVTLDDLRVPPANRLESLQGGRKGQHSLRINDQWRVCFRWKDGDAHDVESIGYR
jgi:proteic killer suppression protein